LLAVVFLALAFLAPFVDPAVFLAEDFLAADLPAADFPAVDLFAALFLAGAFLAVAFLAVDFFAALFFAAVFLAGAFFAVAFFAVAFLAVDVFALDFFAAVFLAGAFFAADFFAVPALFLAAVLPEPFVLRSPRSPWPRLAVVFAARRTSAARERPTSSDSLNSPCSSRRTKRLSPGLGSINVRSCAVAI
jgi:hypothetical protein